jgi:hypothetical protein
MARYQHMFSVTVTHEYHADQPVPDLRFVPSAPTAALMEREDMLLRTTAAGMELWQAAPRPERPGPPAGLLHLLRFEVMSADPMLRFYTEWPLTAPLRFSNRYPGADGTEPRLRPARWARRVPNAGMVNQLKQPLFRVDIAFRPAPQAAPPQWRVALASRKLHWKYYFSGALASRQLNIVDLDAADSAPGISFAPALPAAIEGGSAYLSALALPIQKIPQQRLQLREVGAAGKVLIRRLPNASVEKMGKQRGPNGQSLIVAEIYIHQ